MTPIFSLLLIAGFVTGIVYFAFPFIDKLVAWCFPRRLCNPWMRRFALVTLTALIAISLFGGICYLAVQSDTFIFGRD